MLNFGFLEKGLGIVSPSNFVYDFSRKMFLMFHLSDWLYVLRYWVIRAFQLFVSQFVTLFVNFEINLLIFLIKSFLYMAKMLRQTFKYLENEMSF